MATLISGIYRFWSTAVCCATIFEVRMNMIDYDGMHRFLISEEDNAKDYLTPIDHGASLYGCSLSLSSTGELLKHRDLVAYMWIAVVIVPAAYRVSIEVYDQWLQRPHFRLNEHPVPEVLPQ